MKYGIIYMGRRRQAKSWWRMVAAMIASAGIAALAVWLLHLVRRAATLGDVMPVRHAGLPDWLAWGLLIVMVLMLLALACWRALLGPQQMWLDMQEAGKWQQEVLEGQGNDEPWIDELTAFFRHRDVWITPKMARQMQALATPEHAMALPMLDAYLRRELQLRLFVTSLMEIQAICGKGAAA